MDWIDISENKREEYNAIVLHPLQSYEWGEFRGKTGVKVIRKGKISGDKITEGFTLTIHKVPKTKYTIGYLPKGNNPTKELLSELERIGREHNCIFIQLEPNVVKTKNLELKTSNLLRSFHPLFTKFTFILDIRKSEEDLLKSFHPKTRYNIKVAKKHGVTVEIDDSAKAFEQYLRLTKETTTRQKFYAHTPSYHTSMWEVLGTKNSKPKTKGSLNAHLLVAEYKKLTLASWVLFVFHDTLYYPYGASSSEHRNVMSSNLIMWEAILFGKKLGLTNFDMWGALSNTPNANDPWYGFHKFKEGYGATHTEFIGSYDFVISPVLYQGYKIVDKLRWAYLKIKKRH